MVDEGPAPRIPVNQWKLLRRRMHVLLYFLSPEEGLRTPEDLDRLLARAGLESAVRVLRSPEALRSYGLPHAAALLAPWWQALSPGASRRHARVPEAITQTVLADAALRAEIISFVLAQELLSPKLLRLLRESPEAMTRLLSARFREAQERAKRELPGLLQRVRETVDELKRAAEGLLQSQTEENGQAE